jgi:hypothetical protein
VRIGAPYWDTSIARVRMFAIRRHNLIYWRAFPSQFAAVVMNLEVSYSVDPDWRQHWLEYEHRRTWWRNVFELQKFLPSA